MFFFNKTSSVFKRLIPLSTQGVTLLILAAMGISFIAYPSADLVIAISCTFLILVLITFSAICLLRSGYLKKNLRIETRFSGNEAVSKEDVSVTHTLHNCKILPGFALDIDFNFNHTKSTQKRLTLIGSTTDNSRQISTIMQFPHRGIWEQSYVTVTLRDRFGLSKICWNHKSPSSITVFPRSISFPDDNFISSRTTDGDIHQASSAHKGDYYDYKQYDPTEGFSKVMWKMFAKSGELFVRHPEATASDTGRIGIFLVASKEQDYIASTTRGLLETLSAQGREFVFGTDAMFDFMQSAPSSVAQALNLMAMSVWHPEAGSGKGCDSFIHYLLQTNSIASLVIIGDKNGAWRKQADAIATLGSITNQQIGVSLEENATTPRNLFKSLWTSEVKEKLSNEDSISLEFYD